MTWRLPLLAGAVLLAASCGGATTSSTVAAPSTTSIPAATPEAPEITPPPNVADFYEAEGQAEYIRADDDASWTVDPGSCRAAHWFTYLGLGSAFAVTAPADDGSCEVWLGGEMENPNYSGLPAMVCRFESDHGPVRLEPGDGGPILLDDPACAPTGFEQGSPLFD